MKTTGKLSRSQVSTVLREIGVVKAVESIYLSKVHTGSYSSILVGKNTVAKISPESTLDINSRFRMGYIETGASYPNAKSKLKITPGASFCVPGGAARIGPGSSVHVEGDFSMGSSYINSHCRIICEDRISIGDGCAIAWNVELVDTDRKIVHIDNERREKTAPIVIGDGVWIGNNVSIKKGITISDGAVVASDSVVTHDVPSGVLVGGVPATMLSDDIRWESNSN